MAIRSSPFVNARYSRTAACAFACLAAGGLLSACVHPFHDAQVDPRSPIAAEVAKTVRPSAPYPTFVAFPKVPTDIRPHKQYGQAADKVEADAAILLAATDASTWTLTGTEDFAARAFTDAGPALPPVMLDDAETFAKDQKARATPPPPVKR